MSDPPASPSPLGGAPPAPGVAGATQGPPPIGRESLNAPNAVTFARLILAAGLFGLIAWGGLWLTCAGLFVVVAATDFLDGYLARRYGQVTTLGRIVDPFADKFVVVGTLLFLQGRESISPSGDAVGSGVMPWMTLVIVGREMFVSSLRGFLETHGVDFSADWTGKVKTVLQFTAVTGSLLSLSPLLHTLPPEIAGRGWFLWARDAVLWAATLFTAYSGAAYVARGAAALRGSGET